MPFYYSIRDEPDELVRKRTAERLLALRARLEATVPPRTMTDTLLLATWNIREFDSEKYGYRTRESLHYIAEIISHFDLVAVQEVREDLSALDAVQKMLGGWWKYIVTDVTQGTAGNGERMAFVYDSRKVAFGGLAGEVVLPQKKNADPIIQFARTPFICGFRAGWVKFNLCTVHIYYGKAKKDDPRRVQEIGDLAQFLAGKAKSKSQAQPSRPQGEVTGARNTSGENLILLGDFNIFAREDATFKALEDAGFRLPQGLARIGASNLGQNKYFDQIVYLFRAHRFEASGKAGVFNYSDAVFGDGDEALYVAEMGPKYAAKPSPEKKTRFYRDWRTFQMSDHLLLWCELNIDFSTEYLERVKAGEAADAPPPQPSD